MNTMGNRPTNVGSPDASMKFPGYHGISPHNAALALRLTRSSFVERARG
jgi:hypothetical protein